MGYFDDKNEEIAYLKTRMRTMEEELIDLRKRRQDTQPLVAGAMRQGFVNDTQRDALLYAFMALTGESSERLAMFMALNIQPKGWNAPTLTKAPEPLALPPPKDDLPYNSPEHNNDPWGFSI